MGFEKFPNSPSPEEKPLSATEMQEILSALKEEEQRRSAAEGSVSREFGSPELGDVVRRLRKDGSGEPSH